MFQANKQVIQFGQVSLKNLMTAIKVMGAKGANVEGLMKDLETMLAGGTEFVSCEQSIQMCSPWVKIMTKNPSFTAHTISFGGETYVFQTIRGAEPEWVEKKGGSGSMLPELPSFTEGRGDEESIKNLITWVEELPQENLPSPSMAQWLNGVARRAAIDGILSALKVALLRVRRGGDLIPAEFHISMGAEIKKQLSETGLGELTDMVGMLVGAAPDEGASTPAPSDTPTEASPGPAATQATPHDHGQPPVFRKEVVELVTSIMKIQKLRGRALELLKGASPCEEALIRQWAAQKGLRLEASAMHDIADVVPMEA